jgi:hypothetical protein
MHRSPPKRTWYTSTTAESVDGVIHCSGSARGADDFEGQVLTWTGEQGFRLFEDPPCDNALAIVLTGFIREGEYLRRAAADPLRLFWPI